MIEMALPYWIVSVWTWSFSFANAVATGAMLGSDGGFWYMVAAVLGTTGAYASFMLAVDIGSNTIAVGVRDLVGEGVYCTVMVYALFFDSTTRKKLPPQGLRALLSQKSRAWARLAASSGFALMLQMLCGQVRDTMSVQLLSRLGQGFQYRYSVFGTIQDNMWLPMVLGYMVRISGSKLWGAATSAGESESTAAYWRAAFFWMCAILLNGVLLLGAVAAGLALAFRSTLPFSFASDHICELMESVCTAPIYDDLFANGFEAAYVLWAVSILPSVAAPFLSSCLYATMDFDFVRDVSFVNLALYVALSLCCYVFLPPAGAALGLQLAYTLPDVVVSVACAWRLRQLRDGPPAEAAGRLRGTELS